MSEAISISVVIPTCNRMESLRRTLQSLEKSDYPVDEIIVVDSSDLNNAEQVSRERLTIRYIQSVKSVCIQRNIGISQACGKWIFLCDDDIEVPEDYLKKLVQHIEVNANAGAVSGIVLQKEGDDWQQQYPVYSRPALWWNSFFHLGVWGEIKVDGEVFQRWKEKGNHISKAGWPRVIDFSGDYFRTPVYGLGASLVKKDWLLNSQYDEVLDRSGIGDNYGVAMGFTTEGIHVLPSAHVYHHRVEENRTREAVSYYRRLLALDYFITIGKCQAHVSKASFKWSLVGNIVAFMKSRDRQKFYATMKALYLISRDKNPYVLGRRRNEKVIQPML